MRIISIGRAKSSTIRIDSEYVSSHHAEILLLDNGDIFLTDCGSTQGTFLFGKRIEPWVEVPVRRGDKIEFDNVPLNWARVPTLAVPDPATVKGLYGIGKSPRNRYQLSGDSVSRYHATFKEMKNGKWFIQDHSTNGTFINGQRIPSDQDVRITAKDQIICGTVPCVNPLASSSAPISKSILIALASMAVCVALFFAVRFLLNANFGFDPEKATVFIYNESAIKVSFEDDPVKARTGKDWYLAYNFLFDVYYLTQKIEDAKTIGVSGTGFFVSDEGYILTNKHVTNWIWADKKFDNGSQSQTFRNYVELARNASASDWAGALSFWNEEEEEAIYHRIQKSPFELEAVPIKFHIGYSGRNYTELSEMDIASLIEESKNDEVDMAVLQLNSHITPTDNKTNKKHYFNMKKAITDPGKLSKKKQYQTVGYPGGLLLTRVVEKSYCQPTTGYLHLIQEPGKYKIMMQGDKTISGQSGSPVYDSGNRLIGILYGGFTINESTTVCPIVHANDLLDGIL